MIQYTTDELMEIARRDGYSITQIARGYEVFTSDYMGGALHIQKLDCVNKFESDKEASEQAEKDGIKIIKNLPISKEDEDFGYFIDTKSNREIIRKYLATRGLELDESKTRTIKVFFEDGEYLVTRIFGTKQEIKDYYMGKTFNFGIVKDRILEVTHIEFLA